MEKKTNVKTSVQFDSRREGIRIVKVAAFCFAIISWIATSQGLHAYVFQEYYWQAALVSFGIQSILFVFNLKLPEYFDQIGKNTPDAERKFRKYHWGKKRGQDKKRYKWVPLQKLVAVFYAIVLLASSFFSFVYITNLVYKDTQYVDANIVLDRTYRTYLSDSENYVNEYLKITLIIIGKRLSELQQMMPNNVHHSSRKTLEELEQDVIEAESERDKKQNAVDARNDTYVQLKEIAATPISVRWRSSEGIKRELEDAEAARLELLAAQDDLSDAKAKLTVAEQALKSYTPPAENILHDLLVEVLNPSPKVEKLNSLMAELNDKVIQIDEVEVSIENFATIVTKTEELTLVIKNYETLQTIQNMDKDGNTAPLDQNSVDANFAIPIPSSETFELQKEEWEGIWKGRFSLLENRIKNMPDYTAAIISGFDDIEEIVDIQSLRKFKKEEVIDRVDWILRSNLANINALERACNLLFSNFPFLAWFSFILALFLDTTSLMAGLFIYVTSAQSGRDKVRTN